MTTSYPIPSLNQAYAGVYLPNAIAVVDSHAVSRWRCLRRLVVDAVFRPLLRLLACLRPHLFRPCTGYSGGLLTVPRQALARRPTPCSALVKIVALVALVAPSIHIALAFSFLAYPPCAKTLRVPPCGDHPPCGLITGERLFL